MSLHSIRTALMVLACGFCSAADPSGFKVELFEDCTGQDLVMNGLRPALSWESPTLALGALPGKLSLAGMTMHRAQPFVVRLQGQTNFASGEYEFQLRSRMKARFYLDDQLVLSSEVVKETPLTPQQIAAQQAEEKKTRDEAATQQAEQDARESALLRRLEDPTTAPSEASRQAVQAELDKVRQAGEKSDSKPPAAMQTTSKKWVVIGGIHWLRLEFTGTDFAREVSVSHRKGSEPFTLAGAGEGIRYTERGWSEWKNRETKRADEILDQARRPLIAAWEQAWRERHASLKEQQPASGSIDQFINAKLADCGVNPAPLTDDYEFVRRIYLGAWGIIPTAEEISRFVGDSRDEKRKDLIDELLGNAKWADPWVGYWEDVLAENPVIFGMVPNSTGPFKNWIHRSIVEDRGYDRFATELVLMEGSDRQFGTLGFRESTGNDLPMAEKAHVLSQAFMAANMKCARCHDSPINGFKQRDLFGIAAMLAGKPVVVPATSSVGAVPGRRKPAVSVTSKPGDAIPPAFVFEADRDAGQIKGDDRAFRVAFAEWMVGHRRFAEVAVNRIWKRFMGTGLVEPIDNWGRNPPVSHPDLLNYLVEQFQASGYSVRRIEELILKSDTYQRKRVPDLSAKKSDGLALFAAQPERRMRAEELVDSLHRAVRREFKSERMSYSSVDYGFPKRTWQLVTLSNEEDNAILVRPLLQEILTTASSFGWRDQRPDPVSVRNDDANPLQSLTLANGALTSRLVRLADANYFARLAATDISLNQFENELMLNTLSRLPSTWEKEWLNERLQSAWDSRRVPATTAVTAGVTDSAVNVKYQNMLDAYKYIAESRKEEPATRALTGDFRRRLEQTLWVIFNSPEFIFVP